MHVLLHYSLQAVYAATSTTKHGQQSMQYDWPAPQSNLHLDGHGLDRQQHKHANGFEMTEINHALVATPLHGVWQSSIHLQRHLLESGFS